MSQLSEQELLARIRRGDLSALGDRLRAEQGRLFGICLRMLGNRDDAAEATQETMLKVVEHIRSFRGESGLGTWMVRIAMNQATSRLRVRARRSTLSLEQASSNGKAGGDDQASGLREQICDSREPSPSHSVQRDEQRQILHDALLKLDEPFRAVLVLRDLGQMDYQQIAQSLQLSVGTVKSRLFRARLALRKVLQEYERTTESAIPESDRPEVNAR